MKKTVCAVFLILMSFGAWAEEEKKPVRLCGLVERIGPLYQLDIKQQERIYLAAINEGLGRTFGMIYSHTVGSSGLRLRACLHGPSLPSVEVIDATVIYKFVFTDVTPFIDPNAGHEGGRADAPEAAEDFTESDRFSGFTTGL